MNKLFSLLFFLLIAAHAFSQEEPEPIPNGTQGEVFESDTVKPKRKYEKWYMFDGPLTTLQIGGGFLFEFAGYIQDDNAKTQTDSAGAALEHYAVRDFRVTLSGKFKIKRQLTWKAGIMYDGGSDSWFLRESGVMVELPRIRSSIFVGRTKEGFSLNKVMVGYAGWTMERQMALDVIPILADGAKLLGFLPKQRLFWNIGMYHDFLSKNQSFSTFRWQFAARVGVLPVANKATHTLLHLAVNYRYGKVAEGAIRVRSRPEANTAGFFIDTDKFLTDHSNHIGGEIYFSRGPLLIGSEYYVHMFSSPSAGNPSFNGGDVVITYLITGEKRPYRTASNIYGFVPVDKPVFQGGPGAWEVVLRWSHLDLDDGTLQGGRLWRITPMVNWYLSKNLRLELAYGYGVLERFGLKGGTHFFQTRVQLSL